MACSAWLTMVLVTLYICGTQVLEKKKGKELIEVRELNMVIQGSYP